MKLSTNLLKHVVKLTNARGQNVHLLGTAHVSERSCLEVKELIHTIKPAAVFVELCEQRKGILEHGSKDDIDLTNKEIWDKVQSNEMNPFQVMYLSVMKMYNLRPGKEFVTASDAAKELGIPLVLGDRPVGITLSRLWMGLTAWQKAKLMWYFLPKPTFDNSAVTSFQEKDVNQLLDNRDIIAEETHRLGKLLPWVVECLINERDLFMVLELEMVLEELKQGDVVAVVGAGHLEGMHKQWTDRHTPPLPSKEATQKIYEHILLYPGMQGVNYTRKELMAYAEAATKGMQ